MSELLFQLYRKEVENRTAAVVADDKPFVIDELKKFIPTHVDGADAFNDDLDVYSDSLAATVEVANKTIATLPDANVIKAFKKDFMTTMVNMKVLAEQVRLADGFGPTYNALASFETFKTKMQECRTAYEQHRNGIYITNVIPSIKGSTTDGKKSYVKEIIAGVAIGVLTFVGIVLVSVFLPAAELMAVTSSAAAAGLGVLFI